jgi:hypothetical protein
MNENLKNELNFNIQVSARDFVQLSQRAELLEIACNEKDERIAELERQLAYASNAYNALMNYINSGAFIHSSGEEYAETTGHQMLGGKHIFVVGACACKPRNLLGFAKKTYGFSNADFRFVSDYGKIKNREIKIRSDKLAGIIVGPVPHYADGASYDLMKFIADWHDIVPIAICKAKQGVIKITKQSFADSLEKLLSEFKVNY